MEMIEKLARMDITARETKLIWFFIAQLQGNLLKQKLIKTEEIVKWTNLPRQHAIASVKSLIKKGVIKRQSTSFYAHYWYSFHEENFGRVHAVETLKEDVRGLRLIHGGKMPEKLSTSDEKEKEERHQSDDAFQEDRHQVGYSAVTDSVTVPRSKIAQSSYRGETISQRQKELDAHEGRKREYIPRGGESIDAKIARWKEKGTG